MVGCYELIFFKLEDAAITRVNKIDYPEIPTDYRTKCLWNILRFNLEVTNQEYQLSQIIKKKIKTNKLYQRVLDNGDQRIRFYAQFSLLKYELSAQVSYPLPNGCNRFDSPKLRSNDNQRMKDLTGMQHNVA